MENPLYTVILFYKFVEIDNPKRLMKEQKELCASLGLLGRLLIAGEGINGTFEGITEAIEAYITSLKSDERFKNVVFKKSEGNGKAFTKLQIKVRPEIVTLGVSFDVPKETAPTVSAAELQRMYEKDEDFVVLDLRNDFELDVGQFEKTYNPKLRNFRDLPEKLPELESLKTKKVIAVCTGDIRCEKATCLLKKEGFTNLYHLEDGIHTYMQQYPGQHFKGSLFVFDNRMTTPVIDTPDRSVIGRCISCASPCEEFYSDDSIRPSRKVICCTNCIGNYRNFRKCSSVV